VTATGQDRVDVATLRAAHPIEQVIAASGVELHPRGHGYIGCCPFHDDTTPSLSVGGVPERFKCFGCGAAGDVIEFVARLHHLSFVDAVHALEQGTIGRAAVPAAQPLRVVPPAATPPAITADRAYDINLLAWHHFSTPVATTFAHSYLRHHRGLDLTTLEAENPRWPLVGHAGSGWTTLTDRLRTEGVSDEELLATDLAQTTKAGRIVDTLRDRLIFPVTDPAGRIGGFIGRDITGDPRAPKYRNPTRTPTFDKSATLYRPTHHRLDVDASVVVVEGVLDALSIAAAAARLGHMGRFASCTASGVTVSDVQVEAVLNLHERPVVIALDGDTAGADGTDRWLTAICLHRGRLALTSRLPGGLDPADWLRLHGDSGLTAFDRCHCLDPQVTDVVPHLPGRELVQLSLATGRDPLQHTVSVVLPLALKLPPRAAIELLNQAEGEMTRQGWNPNGVFRETVRDSALSIWRERQAQKSLSTGLAPVEASIHRFPTGPSPGVA
jgi:DNA primase